MLRALPTTLFDATVAGATFSKTLWPGAFTATLPSVGGGNAVAITSGGNTAGGVVSPRPNSAGLILDFAAVGTADQTLVVEVGKVSAVGGMAIPLASVALKSITTSGTIANVEPYTGEATAGVTWRLFDLATITSYCTPSQIMSNVNGTESERPVQMLLDTQEGVWYYIVITTLPAGLTRVKCDMTPLGFGISRTIAIT